MIRALILAGVGVAFAHVPLAAAPPVAPAAAVDRQVAAYNAGNATAFAASYSPDAVIYDTSASETPKLRGRDAIRIYYAALFARAPKRRAIILGRLKSGAYVTDHERLSGTQLHAVVTYEVKDGLIVRVWMHPTSRP